jgi:peroxiredoxin
MSSAITCRFNRAGFLLRSDRHFGRISALAGNYFIIPSHDFPPEEHPVPETFPLAPEFELADAQGYKVSLSKFRGRLNVLLVFNRGLACPFCRRYLTQMRWDAPAFESRRTVILAVSPDRADQVRAYWETEDLPFPGFADSDHQVASEYGQKVDLFGKGRLPSIVLVDRQGRIRYRYDGSSAPDLPSNETLLSELDKINREDAGG